MFFIYKVLINIVFLFSPVIIIIRLIKRKENIKRFIEKFGFFTKKRVYGKLFWFHGASVGEIQSIIPLIEKLEKDKKIYRKKANYKISDNNLLTTNSDNINELCKIRSIRRLEKRDIEQLYSNWSKDKES